MATLGRGKLTGHPLSQHVPYSSLPVCVHPHSEQDRIEQKPGVLDVASQGHPRYMPLHDARLLDGSSTVPPQPPASQLAVLPQLSMMTGLHLHPAKLPRQCASLDQ